MCQCVCVCVCVYVYVLVNVCRSLCVYGWVTSDRASVTGATSDDRKQQQSVQIESFVTWASEWVVCCCWVYDTPVHARIVTHALNQQCTTIQERPGRGLALECTPDCAIKPHCDKWDCRSLICVLQSMQHRSFVS